MHWYQHCWDWHGIDTGIGTGISIVGTGIGTGISIVGTGIDIGISIVGTGLPLIGTIDKL